MVDYCWARLYKKKNVNNYLHFNEITIHSLYLFLITCLNITVELTLSVAHVWILNLQMKQFLY